MKIMNSQSIAKSNRDSSIFTSSDKFRNLTNKTLQEPESYWSIIKRKNPTGNLTLYVDI